MRHPIRLELGIFCLLLALIVLGPAAHSWFEWRLSRDISATQAAIEQRLTTVESFVRNRGVVRPADVLAWLQSHSVACPVLPDCPPCVPAEESATTDDPSGS